MRVECCMHKRLSERYFRRPGHILVYRKSTGLEGLKNAWGNEGRNKRDIRTYVYIFPKEEGKRRGHALRLAGLVEKWKEGRGERGGGGVSKKSQLERILGLETSRCV